MVPIKQNPHFLLVYCCSVARRRRYRIIDVNLLNWLQPVGQNLPGGRGSSVWTLHVLSISPASSPSPKTIRDRVMMHGWRDDGWMNGICRLFVSYVHSIVNHLLHVARISPVSSIKLISFTSNISDADSYPCRWWRWSRACHLCPQLTPVSFTSCDRGFGSWRERRLSCRQRTRDWRPCWSTVSPDPVCTVWYHSVLCCVIEGKVKLKLKSGVCVSQKSLDSCPPCGRPWARPTATIPSQHQPAGVTTIPHTCISSTPPIRTLSYALRSTASSSRRIWAGTFLSLGARWAPRTRRCQGTSG